MEKLEFKVPPHVVMARGGDEDSLSLLEDEKEMIELQKYKIAAILPLLFIP